MSKSFTISELAERVQGVARGANLVPITGIADLDEAGPTHASFCSGDKYIKRVETSRAGVVLVPKGFGPTPMPAIECERIDRSVSLLIAAFVDAPAHPPIGIHPTAVIDAQAKIGVRCAVGPHVVVQAGASIGDACVLHAGVFIGRGTVLSNDCVLWPHVVVRDGCRLGNRVVIHPNAVIGADGFGYFFENGRHQKIEHIGGVTLEDDVEVGACSCIDRAKFGQTIVGRGTKIDNLVQIAHNDRIGEHCILAGCSGLSGSVRLGDYAVLGGRAGVTDGASIGQGARIGLYSVVTHDIAAGMTVSGFPAQEHRKELRDQAARRRVPELIQQVKALVARVERLESATHDRP